MATPSAVSLTDQTIFDSYDLFKPAIQTMLNAKYGDQFLSTFDKIKSMGYVTPTAREDYSNFSDDFFTSNIHVKNTVAQPATGATIDITLDTVDLDSSNRFYVRERQIVYFPVVGGGTVTGIVEVGGIDVSSPTAPVITIKPVSSTDRLPGVTAGQELFLGAIIGSKGGFDPIPTKSGEDMDTFNLQIIKERIKMTGSDMTEQLWVTNYSEGNTPILSYIDKLKFEANYKLRKAASLAWLLNRKSSAGQNVDSDTGEDLRTGEGLYPYTERKGTTLNYQPGFFSVMKFDEISANLEKNNAGIDIWVGGGFGFMNEKDNALQAFFADKNIDQFRTKVTNGVFGGNIEMEASVCYKYLYKGQRGFAFTKIGEFSDPRGAGTSGYNYYGSAIFLPMKKQVTRVSEDGSSSELPRFGMRFKKLGNHNRMMQMYKLGGAGENAADFTSDEDAQNWGYRMHIGFEGVGGNQFVVLYPKA